MKIKEASHILLAVIVSAFVVSFRALSLEGFLFAGLFFVVIFVFNMGAKKLWAYNIQSDVETKIWQFQRYGFYERSYFKVPVPVGIIFPFLLSILSLGYVPWLATTQTEVLASKARVAKRHGLYRYSEMTDSDIAWITAAGIFACLVLAIISYLVGLSSLSKYAVLFAVFNMIPLGNLDGTKILFGNKILWTVLAVISLIGLGYVIWLV